ncbi:roadblock/LC7 domain-containing protein [Kutzneria chonburiensis]|uniref:Roadblock/LC7 domain-containing protein n=1 Tax=Kutzneria chonburiensis TaxID=1483604 RepID=A0ABV6N888_9PSEU|nr:roadblock/LC7 domain-containing protein [Kutzneria chonburiensis]
MTNQEPGDFAWFITDFVRRVAEVAHAVVVSADGLMLAGSHALPSDRAEQVSSVASGLVSLAKGAARCFDYGEVVQTIVEMRQGYLFLMSISDGSCLAVLAAPNCQMDVVAYEMSMLVERMASRLTPELRAQLIAAAAQV